MWQRLMDSLPDVRPGTFEIRDLIGLAVAGVAVVLSWYAIRMSRRQEAIALEQAAITKRQGDIAETQHQIMLTQLAAKAHLAMDYLVVDAQPNKGDRIRLVVTNTGKRTAHDFNWEFFLPAEMSSTITIDIPGADVVSGVVRVEGQQGLFRAVAGRSGQKVYPERNQIIGDIISSGEVGGMICHYVIVAEDGIFSGPIQF